MRGFVTGQGTVVHVFYHFPDRLLPSLAQTLACGCGSEMHFLIDHFS